MPSRFAESSLPQYVCEHCITDDYLKSALAIVTNDNGASCDFCDTNSLNEPICLYEIDDLLNLIETAVYAHFAPPEEVLLRDNESESGWSHEPAWGPEIIRHEIPEFTENDDLREHVAKAWNEIDLVKREFMQEDFHEAMNNAWEKFCHIVMHEARYFVQAKPTSSWDHDGSEIPGQEFLDVAAETVRRLDLFAIFKPDDAPSFYRSRIHDGENAFSTAEQLGTPPRSAARFSNRMSPAGIPMFYGGLDEATAIAETMQSWKHRPATITTGAWRAISPLYLLDLRQPTAISSFYNIQDNSVREGQLFLWKFAKSLSQPVAKDGYEHVAYAPTQVLTEFFRRVFRHGDPPDQNRVQSDWPIGLHGIIYNSAIHAAGTCVVLFIEAEQCGEPGGKRRPYGPKPLIELIPERNRHITLCESDTTESILQANSLIAKEGPESLFE